MKRLILLMLFLAAFTLNAQDTLFVSSNTIELSKAGKRIYKGANILYVKKNLPSNIQFGNASSFYELVAPAGQLNVSINGAPAVSGMSYESIYNAIKNNLTSLSSASGGSSVSVTNFPTTQVISGTVTASTGLLQPLTDTQLRAASLPLPTGAATSALQATANTSLASIDTKTPVLGQALATSSVPVVLPAAQISALTPLSSISITGGNAVAVKVDGRVVATAPTATSGVITSITTNATGSIFTTFASQACTQLYVANNTGTTIEFQLGGVGTSMPIFNGAYYLITGITNASNVGVRRTDQANTQVTIQAHAISN